MNEKTLKLDDREIAIESIARDLGYAPTSEQLSAMVDYTGDRQIESAVREYVIGFSVRRWTPPARVS